MLSCAPADACLSPCALCFMWVSAVPCLQLLGFDRVLAVIRSPNADMLMRAAYTDVMHCLHVDCSPHFPGTPPRCQHPNLPQFLARQGRDPWEWPLCCVFSLHSTHCDFL